MLKQEAFDGVGSGRSHCIDLVVSRYMYIRVLEDNTVGITTKALSYFLGLKNVTGNSRSFGVSLHQQS